MRETKGVREIGMVDVEALRDDMLETAKRKRDIAAKRRQQAQQLLDQGRINDAVIYESLAESNEQTAEIFATQAEKVDKQIQAYLKSKEQA